MPFDYLHTFVPKNYTEAGEKAEAQYIEELEDRAALLYRLGYEKDDAVRRLRGNLYWDWECNPKPKFVDNLHKAVQGIVDKVYSRPRPPEKGRRVTHEDLKTPPSD